MTLDILTAAGEEYTVKNALDGTTITVGLYRDNVDNIQDAEFDPTAAVTSEPTNAAYARETVAVSAAETASDVWGVQNDSAMSFDFSDTTTSQNIDGAFILTNFNSTHAGGTGNWIIATAAATQVHDIGTIDTIDVAAGDLEINFS